MWFRYLVEQNCIKPLCDLLVYSDSRIISYCLDGWENIMRAGEAEKKKPGEVNCYSQLIVDAQGKEKIRNLHRHKEHEFKIFRILKTYCRLLREAWRFQTPKKMIRVSLYHCFLRAILCFLSLITTGLKLAKETNQNKYYQIKFSNKSF